MLWRRPFQAAAVLVALLVGTSLGDQPNPKAETQTALKKLESWLGPGANGTQWKKYLALDNLHAQLDRGDADVDALKGVLAKLESDAVGLEKPQFVELRTPLAAWIDELSVPPREKLVDAIKQASAEFYAPSAQDVELAKAKLSRSVASLDKYLTGLRGVGPGWRTYLRLNDLKTQLKPEAKPDPKQLEEIATRFGADKPGLEAPAILATNADLIEYHELLEAAAYQDLQKDRATHLTELADLLGKYLAAPSEPTAAEVNRRLGWLARTHQDRALIRAIRHHLADPNLFVSVKRKIVGAGIERAIDDKMPLRDVIMGTQINGTGHTVGKVEVQLVPDDRRAKLDAMLSGTTYSNTVGQNGPATIHSHGTTKIAGRKRVMIDATGIHSYPATAAAVTKTRIAGISAGGSIANRIATDRVYEAKGQAEQIGARHAEARIQERLDKEFATNLNKANRDFLDKFRNPLLRRRQFPEVFDLSTTADFLYLTALEASNAEVAAPAAAPKLDASEYDVAVRLHESAANNMAAAMLAGVTLNNEEVKKQIIEIRGSLPDRLKEDEDTEPWSITFAKYRPISVSIRDGGFEVVIRGSGYTSGDRKFKAMNVRAVYKAEKKGNGAKLVRQGDLEIVPPNFEPGTSKLSGQQVALRTILQKKFGKMFEPEIVSEGLELSGRWKQAGKLGLELLQTENGWAVLGWRQLSPTATPGKVASISR